jgi:tight adherence protein C
MSSLVLVGGLAAIFLALFVAIAVFAFGRGQTPVARGITAIDQVYAPGLAESARQERAELGTPISGMAAGVGRTLMPSGVSGWVQRQLEYAGNPPNWPPSRVTEMEGVGAVTLAIVGALIGLLANGVVGLLVGLVVGLLVGVGIPMFVLYDAANRRQDQIRRDLPDALDLLTLSVEAGQGFDAALAQVASIMPGPLSREISRALHEMQMGMRRGDAIRAMGSRTSVSELRSFCTSVVQAGELGIPIANVLREQAQEMRLKRRQRADEMARKVPVKMVVPLVLCLLPALFITVLGPAALALMKSGLFGGSAGP